MNICKEASARAAAGLGGEGGLLAELLRLPQGRQRHVVRLLRAPQLRARVCERERERESSEPAAGPTAARKERVRGVGGGLGTTPPHTHPDNATLYACCGPQSCENRVRVRVCVSY